MKEQRAFLHLSSIYHRHNVLIRITSTIPATTSTNTRRQPLLCGPDIE